MIWRKVGRAAYEKAWVLDLVQDPERVSRDIGLENISCHCSFTWVRMTL